MARGEYDTIIKNRIYKDAKKSWNIELIQSDMVWYDLVVNDHEIFPLGKIVKERFRNLNQFVKDTLEKRFVYFIASRKKVRFSTAKQPKYSLIGKKLYIFLEVGKEKKIKKVVFPLSYEGSERPQVEASDKFLTFTDVRGDKYTISIHDFLLNNRINIGLETFVQYVGKTKVPEQRPIDGSHVGLNKVLYKLSNEDNDIFIFYNIFKVMVLARNEEFNAEFLASNSMTNEINVNKEGDILEKSFILHFSSENQLQNLDREIGEFRNNLIEIAIKNKIEKLTMRYEVDDESEYYKFGSSSIKAKHNHSFTYIVENNSLVKREEGSFFD